LIWVELAYGVVSLAAGGALVLALGPVAEATNLTSVRILGAALLALGIGALALARDPVGNRVMLAVEIVFTTVSSLALLWKLVVDGVSDRTVVLLPALVVCAVLLVVLSPATRPAQRDESARQGPPSRKRWDT
jgi:hypothetical protein